MEEQEIRAKIKFEWHLWHVCWTWPLTYSIQNVISSSLREIWSLKEYLRLWCSQGRTRRTHSRTQDGQWRQKNSCSPHGLPKTNKWIKVWKDVNSHVPSGPGGPLAPGRPMPPEGPAALAGCPCSPFGPFSPSSPFLPNGPMRSHTDRKERKWKWYFTLLDTGIKSRLIDLSKVSVDVWDQGWSSCVASVSWDASKLIFCPQKTRHWPLAL